MKTIVELRGGQKYLRIKLRKWAKYSKKRVYVMQQYHTGINAKIRKAGYIDEKGLHLTDPYASSKVKKYLQRNTRKIYKEFFG